MQGWRMVLGAVAVLVMVWGAVRMTYSESDRSNRRDHAAQAAETATVIAVTEEADNGRSIVMPLGATLSMTLQSNPSTGYQWTIVDPLPSCLTVISGGAMLPMESSNDLVGAPGQWRATLKAAQPGEGTVRVTYRRAWEKTAPAAKTFSVTVRVE